MKTQLLKAGLTFCFIVSGAVAWSAEQTPASTNTTAAATSGVGPKIQFATPVYDFGKVTVGTLVKHDFVFTNTGDAMLEITAVNAGCGCTTIGEWSHQVEPGKTGVIPIQFNSAGYGGNITKTPSLSCNDPSQPNITLQLHGTVFKPVEVTPSFVSLVPDSAGNATATVHIVSYEDEALTLSKPESNLRAFTAELKTNAEGKDFTLTIKTVPPIGPETAQGIITIHSSSTNMPDISILTSATMQQPPAAPPTAQPATNVSIQVTPPAK